MNRRMQEKDYFKASQLVVLVFYSILVVMLTAESFLLGWETWAVMLVWAGFAISWVVHIRQDLSPNARLWVYALMMMGGTFFYGIHVTSTYDLGLVLTVFILIFISTGIPALITLCQVTYYIVIAYNIYQMYTSGEIFDSLMITRTALHLVVVTVVCYIARGVIRKWIDIMEESESEKEMLAETADRLNDFLANISHEIRTPINAVIGLTGVCMEKEKDPQIRQDLASVSEAGRRVGDQISDILDYSEIDMDSLAVNNEDYILSSLISDIVTSIKLQRKLDIELVIDVDPSIPLIMNTDVGKLKKIIRHLIDNGLKYTKEGGVYVHFTAEKRDYGINLCIEVRDTGIGMSKSEMEMVFHRFYQADSGRTRSTSGLGLGLSIVNGFTRRLNGFLTLDSELGKGTTVRVSIPQKVIDDSSCMSLRDPERLRLGAYFHFEKYPNPHVREFYNSMIKDMVIGLRVVMQRADNMTEFKTLADATKFTHVFVAKEEYEEDVEFIEEMAKETIVAVIADDSFVPRKGSRIRIVPKPFYCYPVMSILNTDPGSVEIEEGRLYTNGARALVVDDEPMNHIVAKGIFARYGLKVYTADSGKEAIDFIRNHEVDVIFMDHMMPGMDGVEAMKRIRSVYGKEKKDVPIVALTANAVSTAKEMFIREGFDGFVAKPIELGELERVLKKVLPKSMISYVASDGEVVDAPVDALDVDNVREQSEESEQLSPREAMYKDLESVGVNVQSGLNYCQKDHDFYAEVLEQYGSDGAKKIRNASDYLEKKDFPNYEIIVHAIKSTSLMIGNAHLSEEAKALEEAAKKSDEARIRQTHDAVMEEFGKVVEVILRYLTPETETSASEAPTSESDDDEILEFGPEGGDEA
ncbi:MAG: response regulator [Lachnospiraceae bacterium]|nr:response regulator [Lachnospiraceae bacterium]